MSIVLAALRKSSPESVDPARGGTAEAVGAESHGASGSRPLLIALAVLAAGVAGATVQQWSRHAAAPPPPQPVAAEPVPPAPAIAPNSASLALSRSIDKRVGRPAPSPTGEPGTAAAAPPPIAGRELPVALRRQLPRLAVRGYVMDEKSGSVAIVDDQVLRVGEEAAPGLRIEKIDAGGVTFSYQGYRFRR